MSYKILFDKHASVFLYIFVKKLRCSSSNKITLWWVERLDVDCVIFGPVFTLKSIPAPSNISRFSDIIQGGLVGLVEISARALIYWHWIQQKISICSYFNPAWSIESIFQRWEMINNVFAGNPFVCKQLIVNYNKPFAIIKSVHQSWQKIFKLDLNQIQLEFEFTNLILDPFSFIG